MSDDWQQTACILCECNCGIVVQTEGGHLAKIRGDKDHPASQGYTCEKALRLDHYQNGRDRLTTPLRRRPDGRAVRDLWKLHRHRGGQRPRRGRDRRRLQYRRRQHS